MSYSKFLNEAGDLINWKKKHNLPSQDYRKTLVELRDIWIKDGRYSELTAFINENWDSGNGDNFVKPYYEHLIINKELNQFKKLWKGILRHRVKTLWTQYKNVKSIFPNITLEIIKSQKLDGFNQFSPTENSVRRLTWNREYVLKGIFQYSEGLKEMNDQSELQKIQILYNNIEKLIEPKVKPSTDKRKIDELVFWTLISNARNTAVDKHDFIEKLSSKLEEFKPSEIRKFEKIFKTKFEELNLSELWALAYITRNGCGDDAFDYFKAWIISKGESAFESISKINVDELEQYFDEDPQLEEMIYLAQNVYESKTGEFMNPPRVKRNNLKELSWTEETLETDFPNLCIMFKFKNKSNSH